MVADRTSHAGFGAASFERHRAGRRDARHGPLLALVRQDRHACRVLRVRPARALPLPLLMQDVTTAEPEAVLVPVGVAVMVPVVVTVPAALVVPLGVALTVSVALVAPVLVPVAVAVELPVGLPVQPAVTVRAPVSSDDPDGTERSAGTWAVLPRGGRQHRGRRQPDRERR